MTERLYYTDSYLTSFAARVVERLEWDGHPAVVLDRTAFYPTSGGQPSDRGFLNGVPVVDVAVREADGAIVHILEAPLEETDVTGRVDWARRFDHMQQHTGQHLLSAACEQLLGTDTVSFHLGTETSTIDLKIPRLAPEALTPVEDLVNQVIWEDRPVRAFLVSLEDLPSFHLRRPPQVEGPIRLVEVAGKDGGPPFDLTPCGGTHVARTGEIGLLKVLRLDYRGQETRVEFVCGGRAFRDYRLKHETTRQLAALLTVGHRELPDALGRLLEDLKAARREARAAQERLLEAEAAYLAATAIPIGEVRVARAVLEGRDPAELRTLALSIASREKTVAVLAGLGERVHLCVACAEGTADAVAILRVLCDRLGGKGGGQARFAQGSAPAAPRAQVEAALEQALSALAG
ncbi:MAG: DHHA1 domain-containing protein [Anaerolineae bacterium]|nr:DHHA1 domain-containing protein [Anaerolineae bacterium]MCX8068610.1 DHHA1 domain-containing protein [Anaerolineae bacterium]MDW7992855.1 DHHA1 domain-containing protein [Anaerolineae bacterium]